MIKFRKKIYNLLKSKFKLLFLFVLINLIFYIIFANFIIEAVEYKITSIKIPQDFDNFKILQLSDLHGRTFSEENKALIQKIEKINPDIILITGDMVDSSGDDGSVFLSLVKNICKKYKVYYIVGNHEQIIKNRNSKKFAEYCKKLENEGLIILDNESTKIKKGSSYINIYGLWFNLRYYKKAYNKDTADVYFGLEDMEKILGDCDKKVFNLLLAHNPMYFDTYSRWGADLTLSGHIHGGIIRLPFLGGVLSPDITFFPKYDSGLYSLYGNEMLVNRGLGFSKIKVRIFNPPELSVIILKTIKNK